VSAAIGKLTRGGGRIRQRTKSVRSPKWESRRETRFSPASFALGGPEPTDACAARFRAGGAAREKETFARTSTEPRGSGNESD